MKKIIFFSALFAIFAMGVNGHSSSNREFQTDNQTGYQDVRIRKLNCETTLDGMDLKGSLIDGYESSDEAIGHYSMLDLGSKDSVDRILVLNTKQLSEDPQESRDKLNSRVDYDFPFDKTFDDARGFKNCGQTTRKKSDGSLVSDECVVVLESKSNQRGNVKKEYLLNIVNVDQATQQKSVFYSAALTCSE